MVPEGEQTGFVYTTHIQENPQRVWQALTDPALMRSASLIQSSWEARQ
jgi:uncharacterized protein YndB with AHSA1/START domain